VAGGSNLVHYLTVLQYPSPEPEKNKVMTDLEQYCGRDTEGMIWIVEKLRALISK